MKALYYNAILGILLSFPSFLKAQIRPFEPLNPDRIFFKGKVVDTDNNALPKVSIYIPGSMRGTISDSNGNFYIDAKPKETLYSTYAGKEDAYRQLQEKDTTGFIVQMQPRIQRLKNVHVRKDKKIIEKGEPYEDDRDGTFELYMQMPISQMVKKLYTNSSKKTNNILRKLLSKGKKEKY